MKQAPWLLMDETSVKVGGVVVLSADEARHAAGPLRLTSGAAVVLTDGAGTIAQGTLAFKRRGPAEVAIGAVECVERPSRGLTLATAVLAGGAMDPVVQKAVELGVEQFIPVCCDRSQLGRKRAQSRMGHWVRLARQTLKQCHRPWAMSLLSPMNLADLLMEVPQGHGVVAHRGGRTIGELSLPTDPVLLVGPEGGFTAQEEAALGERAWQRLRLGRHVLRASTAAAAGAAVLVHGHG